MLVYIYPKSAFPELHSDTIFGSLLYAMNQLKMDVPVLVHTFEELPPFLISTAFPFAINENIKTRFFPKPLVKPQRMSMDLVKTFKKIMYVEEDIFKQWVGGETNEGEIVENLKNEYTIGAERFLVKRDSEVDFQKFKIKSISLPRNTINRVTYTSENIFYTLLYNFETAGLFFGIKFYDNKYKSDIMAALKFLRDRGFGEDVSVGKGQFDFEITNEDLPDNSAGEGVITLSRYIPGKELSSFNKEKMWYEIDSKRGRSSNGLIRKQVRFFVEGSTFPEIGREFYGRIAYSAHDAVEYGYAYKIGMKENG